MKKIIFLIAIWIPAFAGMTFFDSAQNDLFAQEFGQADRNFVPSYSTNTSSGGNVSMNTQSGVIISETLSAGPGSFEQITLSNALIGAGSVVLTSVYNETNSSGIPVLVLVSQGSGSVAFRIYNAHTSESFNGTVKIYFLILN